MDSVTTLRLPREPTSVPVARAALGSVLERAGASGPAAYDLLVATSEACTNAVLHAVDGSAFSLELTLHDRQAEVVVTDAGPGFAPDDAPTRLPEATALHGRGLVLMQGLVDRCEVESRPGGGTRVRLVQEVGIQAGR